jgi:hypothetical protein
MVIMRWAILPLESAKATPGNPADIAVAEAMALADAKARNALRSMPWRSSLSMWSSTTFWSVKSGNRLGSNFLGIELPPANLLWLIEPKRNTSNAVRRQRRT